MIELSEPLQREITSAIESRIADAGSDCKVKVSFTKSAVEITLNNCGLKLAVGITNETVLGYKQCAARFVLRTVEKYAKAHNFSF